MALIPCPQCNHAVSRSAVACPQCGHPIAAAEAQKNQVRSSIGCAGLIVLVIGALAWTVHEGQKIQDQEKATPTCVSDYTKCTDNEEVVHRHQTGNGLFLNVVCQSAAEKAANYGSPEFPFFSFGSFYKGRSYIEKGVALLIEDDAKFKNAFGASERVTARCVYDLKQDRATVDIVRK